MHVARSAWAGAVSKHTQPVQYLKTRGTCALRLRALHLLRCASGASMAQLPADPCTLLCAALRAAPTARSSSFAPSLAPRRLFCSCNDGSEVLSCLQHGASGHRSRSSDEWCCPQMAVRWSSGATCSSPHNAIELLVTLAQWARVTPPGAPRPWPCSGAAALWGLWGLPHGKPRCLRRSDKSAPTRVAETARCFAKLSGTHVCTF